MSSDLKLADKLILVRLLLSLTGRSASSFASEIGVFRGSITQWLKHGVSSLGVEKQGELLGRLGVSGGTLSPHIVHRWKVFDDLSNLQKMLSFISESISTVPEIVRLGPITPNPVHLSKYPFSEFLYAITGSFHALLRRSIPATSPAISIWNIEKVFRDNLTGRRILDWKQNIQKDGEFDNEPTIRVENSIFDKWWSDKNEVVSLEEFNQALTPVNPIPFPIFRDMPDWALVERITGKKCPETVSLRNLSRMTQAELKETLGLTDVQTKKLSAALILGERLANLEIDLPDVLIKEKFEKSKKVDE